MKVLGVIAEFNPFHNGHQALLEQRKVLGYTHTLVVMSGNFVQRAQPAHTDKWTRTKAALLHGADVVIELPVIHATASAREFAQGAVSILQATGLVDGLLFGSEGGAISPLLHLAHLLQNPSLAPLLKQQLGEGHTFALARQKAVDALDPSLGALLAQPNNLLGLAYLQGADKLGWAPDFHTFQRQGVAHHSSEPQRGFASATYLRSQGTQWAQLQPFVPPAALELYKKRAREGGYPLDYTSFETVLLPHLRRLSIQDIRQLPDISEGVEHRLLQAFNEATSLNQLYELIKTKRYPLSRVRRWVLSAFLSLPKELLLQPPPYLRILGFNAKGRDVLGALKSTATRPFSLQLKRLQSQSPPCDRWGQLEALATDLYALMLPVPLPSGLDYTHPGVILK